MTFIYGILTIITVLSFFYGVGYLADWIGAERPDHTEVGYLIFVGFLVSAVLTLVISLIMAIGTGVEKML